MPLNGEYVPSAAGWVRDQVDLYERSGGTEGTTLRQTGQPVVVVTSVGHASGKLRKNPVMRVEHEGAYAVIASMGGAPQNPRWVKNFEANPQVELQDKTEKWDMTVRLVTGAERDEWWERAVAVFPNYAEYQAKTERVIPVYIAERA